MFCFRHEQLEELVSCQRIHSIFELFEGANLLAAYG